MTRERMERIRQLLRERGPRCPHGHVYGEANSDHRWGASFACPIAQCSCCRWVFGYHNYEGHLDVPDRCPACRTADDQAA